jgi:hypothetical protein
MAIYATSTLFFFKNECAVYNFFMLYIGRFFNAIILLVVTLVATSLTLYILSRWKKISRELRLFGLFWLFTTLLWLFVTGRSLAGAFNNYELDVLFFLVAQVFVFISAIFLGGYIFEKLFHSKIVTYSLLGIYAILASIGRWFTFTNEIMPVDLVNFFATEYQPSPEASLIFKINMFPLIALLLFDIGKQIYGLIRRIILSYTGIAASFSILLYLVVGYFDQIGIPGWPVLVFRLLFIGSFLMAYASITGVPKDEYIISISDKIKDKQKKNL